MVQTSPNAKKINPRDKSNFLSKIFFLFACTTFRKGYRKCLQEEDVYEIAKGYDSPTLSTLLENQWKNVKGNMKNRLFIALFKSFGGIYMAWGLLYLTAGSAFKISQPLLQGKIISYFAPDQTGVTVNEVCYYTGLLCLCLLLHTTVNHSYSFGIRQVVLKIKVAVTGLIYRKALSLSASFTSKDSSGQAITLITKDVEAFEHAMFLFHKLWVGIIQIFIVIYILYDQIGVSALVGVSAILLPLPVQGFIGQKIMNWKIRAGRNTDRRVKSTQEMLTAIRTIKMYTWELFFEKAIIALRKKEVFNLRILLYLKALILSIGILNAKLGLYFCIITYVALDNYITAEKAFVVTGCFATLQNNMTISIPLAIAYVAELKAALERITSFLALEEIGTRSVAKNFYSEKPYVNIRNATVKTEDGHVFINNVTIRFNNGLNLITGPIGSGKSTLLRLVLGELAETSGSVEVCGNVSYASQEPWLFPGSVKQNIVFNEPWNEERYKEVVRVSALRKDFEALPVGDMTCITDKGLNLSRGQKTRINLARALYKVANIYLLDDCLSSVDGQVGKHIFFECKEFLKREICILVSYQELFLRKSDNIIILKNGCLEFYGSYEGLKDGAEEDLKFTLNKCENLIDYHVTTEEIDEDERYPRSSPIDELNVYKENINEGAVSCDVYKTYVKAGGGVALFVFVLLLAVATQGILSWNDYFVSFWVDMEQEMSGFRYNQTTHSAEFKALEKSNKQIMILYSFVVLLGAVFTLAKSFLFYHFTCKASTNIHKLIIKKIINANMTFFNNNLSGNILNRMSRDLAILDERLPATLFYLLKVALLLIGSIVVICSVNPIFLIPSILFLVLLYYGRCLYIPTGRSIRRLEGSTRSPLVGHINSTLEGLATIRANAAEETMKSEFDKHQDVHNSVRYMNFATTEAFGFYLDAISTIYVICIVLTFLIWKTDTLVGRVGLAITQAFGWTKQIEWTVRQWAEIENLMTSGERVLEYQTISGEDTNGAKIKGWPSGGEIVFTNVSLRYNQDHKYVLRNVNLMIKSKQRIGVIGRTGAGKTSIISALYRLYDYEGDITIDGVNIKNVDVLFLRRRISIIPQDPVLFAGTIRSNLDPNEEFTDRELWRALDEVHLKRIVLDLEMRIYEGGTNFSVGQRQLISLARALLCDNNVLVLDEATANMDPHTDKLIQQIIKETFCNCTVITIAHRLNTIMDSDKILVMDSGKVVEYDAPEALLINRESVFYRMVQNNGTVQ
ncbi:probable multidrug resistance-associated protein lethal(2)03659 [Photinus pyralis]|nr:probable multidrug resistance-associated protein lethal(2)03659 [Photinus pyralis]XP_031344906.1 probable multidrug resistance-associated protein lethal(2)03659 [Photinus pyralis]